jgi:hypothetical protein
MNGENLPSARRRAKRFDATPGGDCAVQMLKPGQYSLKVA